MNYESSNKGFPPGQVNMLYSANSSFVATGFRYACRLRHDCGLWLRRRSGVAG